jgi:hypothetical protein
MSDTHPYPEITEAIRVLDSELATIEDRQAAVIRLLQLQIRLMKGA